MNTAMRVKKREDLRRDLHEDVADIEDAQKCVEFLVDEMEVGLEATQPCRSTGAAEDRQGGVLPWRITYDALFLSICASGTVSRSRRGNGDDGDARS